MREEALSLHHRPVLVQAYSTKNTRFTGCRGLSESGRVVERTLKKQRVIGDNRYHVNKLRALLDIPKQTPASLARIELLLADGLLSYAMDLGSESPAEVLSRASDRAALEKLLARLGPPHPRYRGLVAAMRRYRRIVEGGGWERIQPIRRLPARKRHPVFHRLKERLSVEGHYSGVINNRIVGLSKALSSFRRAHGLSKGDLSPAFWRALNVSARKRLQAILLTLERWHEQKLGRDRYYLLVNIPAFKLEVWKDGRLLRRHRVVVGKPYPKKCDERTHRRVLAHATPVQSSEIETLVFGPFWNVTREIKERELDPEDGKAPHYYQRNGYEVLSRSENDTRVRQLPGPENALGFVKFLFESPHNTYLHDTPLKHLFKRRTRAYSHGCVRVQNPRELAKFLLTQDRQWEEDHYRRLYRRWRSVRFASLRRKWNPARYERLRRRALSMQTTVELADPVPIHVAYHTVEVVDGEVRFLRDIYGMDRRTRPAPRCAPESYLARRGFDRMLDRLEALERKAQILAPLTAHASAIGPAVLKKRIWRRRVMRLGSFTVQHASLARRIRDAHTALTEELTREGRWSPRLVLRAVGIRRLLDGLAAMTHRARRICRLALDRMSRGS